ncbi:hypothetical protein MRX96_026005 [Rhipicephalus microplus]
MVVVTSAVTLENRQREMEIDATDCWSRFPWHVVLVIGAVQVLSKIIDANNTLTKTLRPSSWMQQSPLTVQIVLAVVAALLSEAMNNESLSRMLLPLTIHAAVSTRMHPIYYAIPVVVAASSNLIMPITLPPGDSSRGRRSALATPGARRLAVRALNSTSLASRNQAPHY